MNLPFSSWWPAASLGRPVKPGPKWRWPPAGLETRSSRLLAVAVAVWLAVSAVFSVTLFSQRVHVAVGDLAPRNVVAPYGVIDWGATAKAREAAAANVPDVYTTNPAVLGQARAAETAAFRLLFALSEAPGVPMAERVAAAAKGTGLDLSPAVWQEVLSLAPPELAQLEQDSLVILASVMGNGNGVRDTATGLAEARGFVAQLAAQQESDPGLRAFLTAFGQANVRPNTFVNLPDTLARKAEAASQVPLVKILRGEQVLVEGQRVTAADIQVLKELDLLDQGFDPGPIAGSLLFGALMVGVLAVYLWLFRRALLEREGLALMAGLLLVAGLIAADALSGLSVLDYLVVPTVAMLVAAMVDSGLGLLMAGVLALALAVLTGSDVDVALVSFFGGVAAVFAVSVLSRRHDLVWTSLLVGGVNVLGLAGLDVMQGASLLQYHQWQGLVWGFVDGALATWVARATIPLLEGPFGIVTPMKLIELSNPNQPLLRKLLVEAPGTYHHSIMVGNLAEAAAEAVGGNSLLARVGAYYHDVGKAKRPYFFVDNQFGGENPHDKLSPALSALIISSHVRDGLEMARKAHLPEAIVQFIREHHGTTLIGYFYRKAVESDTGEGVVEEDFRYDGPKPQSKETAIVMLADASEAICRTLQHPTPQQIEATVRKIIQDRLQDGQLDDSNLTLKELDVIARTFTRVLTGIFHQRIEYPERVLKEMERSKGRGGVGGKSPRAPLRRMGGHGSAGGPPSAG
ncbi:MAG: HDIG domain-containing protein [Firmicutes bacterium]|nr:HDIG domain-containing protein [Alicyclobacillaceae bacterium]MCL6496935.1 HDIG domain-containing protein [Bacillota bacterium]